MEFNKLFEKVLEESHPNNLKPLREMSKLGRFRDLRVGHRNPAYYGNTNKVEGNPVIPEKFRNLQQIIPDSDWWWISSGSRNHNKKQSSIGTGSFEFRFISTAFFHFVCNYDHLIGFTKIGIGYDDIDTKVEIPNQITIERMEEIVQYNYNEMLSFILEYCILNEEQRQIVQNALNHN